MKSNGTVKWFSTEKGYGFVKPENGKKDIFIHISALQAAGLSGLKENQKIAFEVAKESGKESAVNIELV